MGMRPPWHAFQHDSLSSVFSNVVQKQGMAPLRKDCIMSCDIPNGRWIIKNARYGKMFTYDRMKKRIVKQNAQCFPCCERHMERTDTRMLVC